MPFRVPDPGGVDFGFWQPEKELEGKNSHQVSGQPTLCYFLVKPTFGTQSLLTSFSPQANVAYSWLPPDFTHTVIHAKSNFILIQLRALTFHRF